MTDVRSDSSRRSGAGSQVQRQRRIVWFLAATAAVGAASSGAEPTASVVTDALLNGGAAVVVVYLSSRARRWAWVIFAGAATLAADSPIALLAGGSALAVAFAAVVVDRRSRVIGALVGALGVQALFRLPAWDWTGAATLVAVAAVLPVLVSGYRNFRPAVRRRLWAATSVVAVVALALTALGSLVALNQRSTLHAGIDRARDGLRAAENGRTGRADSLLADAELSFGDAADALSAPWLLPSSGVPVVGQNLEALTVAAKQGAALAATARASLAEADIAADVLQGRVQRVHDGDGEVQREIFLCKVLVHCRDDVAVRRNPRVAVHRHPMRGKRLKCLRHERVGDVCVHQQRLRGIAHRRPLSLGVDQDLECHLFVCCDVDEDVTVAHSGLNDWHLAVAHHVVDLACATARNQHINQSAGSHQLTRDLTRAWHELDDVCRQAGVDEPGPQCFDYCGV